MKLFPHLGSMSDLTEAEFSKLRSLYKGNELYAVKRKRPQLMEAQ